MPTPPPDNPRLAALRGALPTRNHNARTVAAFAANPGCARRGVVDAAGIDKSVLAQRIGYPAPYGQSPFAITRGIAFEAQVKADGGAALRALLADTLGTEPAAGPAPGYEDLSRDEAEPRGREDRAARTRELVRAAAHGARTIIDHPILPLAVGGHRVYLEPDAMACRIAGRLHVVEIKSFAVIDGSADPGKVASAARQAAVYVLALQHLAVELGLDESVVATDVVLVCPRDFSNRPTAALVDVRKQLAATRRRLERMDDVDALLASVPAGVTFDGPDGRGVTHVPASYVPDCLTTCELAYFCRSEAGTGPDALVGALGADVRGALGGITRIADALALADGTRPPAPGEEEVARMLRRAQELRTEALGMEPPR